MIEIWKFIPGYEGIYSASNLGNIRREAHEVIISGYKRYGFKKTEDSYRQYYQKVMKQSNDQDGYKLLTLKGKMYRVHRLICMTFLSNINNYPFVNHKNGIKHDNRVDNLEWTTALDNELHMHRELYPKPRGITWKDNSWQVSISNKSKCIYLGRYKNKEDAYSAYRQKYIELHNKEPW